MMFCPQCGTQYDDKFETRLCCDVRLPNETEADQFKRLFPEEFTDEALEAVRPPPFNAAEFRKQFFLGYRFSARSGYYSTRLLEVHSMSSTGVGTTDALDKTQNRWAPAIHFFDWHQLDAMQKRGDFTEHEPRKPYKRRADLAYLVQNKKRLPENERKDFII